MYQYKCRCAQSPSSMQSPAGRWHLKPNGELYDIQNMLQITSNFMKMKIQQKLSESFLLRQTNMGQNFTDPTCGRDWSKYCNSHNAVDNFAITSILFKHHKTQDGKYQPVGIPTWMAECFSWYLLTQVVPDKRLLNGCCSILFNFVRKNVTLTCTTWCSTRKGCHSLILWNIFLKQFRSHMYSLQIYWRKSTTHTCSISRLLAHTASAASSTICGLFLCTL